MTPAPSLPSTMAAAVYHGPHDIRVTDVAVPTPAPGEALVRVLRSGICGTDATEWVAGPKVFPLEKAHRVTQHVGPMILGHEFIGEVVAIAPDSSFSVGDIVASGAGVWCGECDRCREGRTNLCDNYYTLGLSLDGGMAEYVATPERTLQPVPAGLDLSHAGLAQPLAVGIHAARRSGARDGDRVLIIGGGAIASFVLSGLKHLVDVRITVVEFPGEKQERALRLGAESVISPTETLAEAVPNSFDGSKPDVVIEASGAPGQLATALALVRDGGRVLAVGLPKAKPEIDVHSLVFREVTLDSSLAHVCDTDLGAALEILAQGVLGPELVERVVGLDELGEQLDRLAAGTVDGKILIDPSVRTGVSGR